MLSEKRYASEDRKRPWTVPALIAFGVFSWLISAIFDSALGDRFGADRGLGYTIFSLVVGALFYWGLWLGRRWAYVLTVIGAVLGAFMTLLYVVSERADFEQGLWFVVISAVQVYLLFHPLTRTYFKEPEEADMSGVQA